MKDAKKLESLVLKKHTISRLNEHELNAVEGGLASSPACAIASVVTAVSALSVATYQLGKEESWANCPGLPPTQNPSDKLLDHPDGIRSCELNEVDIHGSRS